VKNYTKSKYGKELEYRSESFDSKEAESFSVVKERKKQEIYPITYNSG
jgi:hypothetical protein